MSEYCPELASELAVGGRTGRGGWKKSLRAGPSCRLGGSCFSPQNRRRKESPPREPARTCISAPGTGGGVARVRRYGRG
jgi:hypothetical protein